MSELNRLRRTLARIDRLPQALRGWVRQKAIHFSIPFTGTAKLVVDELEPDIVRVRINNRRATRNHIKGMHATAIALAAGRFRLMILPRSLSAAPSRTAVRIAAGNSKEISPLHWKSRTDILPA